MQKRTDKFLEVSFYLSNFGYKRNEDRYPLPPIRLKVKKWNAAYRMFYEKLNNGRSILAFERSLKNARDAYDSHLENSGRQGWKTSEQNPNPLGIIAKKVFNNLNDKSEESVWNLIKEFADLEAPSIKNHFSEIIYMQESESENILSVSEGGRKYIISSIYERSPSLRKKAIDIHGKKCQVCEFDFEDFYGDWGKGFIEIHHIRSLA